ncbi:hypothetical protein CYMTET_16083 [Cymbomonas tetramitiformis]|uniref:Uncharacterized protein n=1 Tax=Cymbomonas tetramitiformis TaxID=36881 RepID=A0AAE0GE83_9CHLO|nr:hypothetical protein CYMTET_16083 [Cymbomonas tetramitiformis]
MAGGHLRALARAAWSVRAAEGSCNTLIIYWVYMLLCAVWRVAGLQHFSRATWHVVPVRALLAVACWMWRPTVLWVSLGLAACLALVHALHLAGHVSWGTQTRVSEAAQVFLNVVAGGPATLRWIPLRLRKPRFARRLQRQRRLVLWYRLAQLVYVVLILTLLVFAVAGGELRWIHRGWRLVVCMLASLSPAKPRNVGRILKLFALLVGTLVVLALAGSSARTQWVGEPALGPSPAAATGSSWEAQQSSRQWDTGWECAVTEQEVLPYTVLDELQPGGKTTVTMDEGAWLGTELNATFGGHPDFTEAHWEEMRAIIGRCQNCFANRPQDIRGYHGKARHNTFSIPFKDESKVSYQRPRKYSPGEQEIIDIHCKELLEYGFIEPASQYCAHASNVVVAGKKDHEMGLWTQTPLSESQ